MWGKNWKSSRKLPCLDSDCLPHHHHQIANAKCNEEKLAEETSIGLDACAKESKMNFEETNKDVESLADEKASVENPEENNCSFLHAVINMTGMVIGTRYSMHFIHHQ